MNKIIGEYAYAIVMILGFCILLLISWFYSSLGISDEKDFWLSVLPSAFVDIISLVVSTILITKIIEKQKKYIKQRDLFEIVTEDHKLLVMVLKNNYRIMMQVKENTNISKVFEVIDFDFENINEILKINADKDFQSHIVHRTKGETEINKDGVQTVSFKTESFTRLKLFEEYVELANRHITKHIKDYGAFFNFNYLNVLINIKKSLNNNPFEIHDIFGITPVILDIENFANKNQNYINAVLTLEKHFEDFQADVEVSKKRMGSNNYWCRGYFCGFYFKKSRNVFNLIIVYFIMLFVDLDRFYIIIKSV